MPRSRFASSLVRTLPLLAVWILLAAPSVASEKYVRRLESWARSTSSHRAGLELDRVRETLAKGLAADLSEKAQRRLDLALMDLLGSATSPEARAGEQQLAPHWRQGLDRRLDLVGPNATLELIAKEVLAEPDEFDAEVALGAAEALVGRHQPASLPPLTRIVLSSNREAPLRAAAARALAGWPVEAASTALLESALMADADDAPRAQLDLLRHLSSIERSFGPPGPPHGWMDAHAKALLRSGLDALVAEDWREASRAVELARFAPPEATASRLVESLAYWLRREELAQDAGDLTGVLRLQLEIASSLRALTGAQIGPYPHRWRGFLSSVRKTGGTIANEASDEGATTVAGFFGLPIDSGSIAFVLDSSGSMRTPPPPGTGPRGSTDLDATRYDAASRNLVDSLSVAPASTRFHVVLFSTRARVWRDSATQATATGRRAAQSWLDSHGPDGGTNLSSGFDALLKLGPGVDDEGRLPFDTVIVLCDGATVEGASWARSWMERYGHPAGLRIHAVQIGGGGAEALRALTSDSGGTFVEL